MTIATNSEEPGDSTDVYRTIVAALADATGKAESEILPDYDLVNDLELDSLDIVELVMKIEDHFAVAISDEDAQTLRTVRQVCDFVEAKLRERGGE